MTDKETLIPIVETIEGTVQQESSISGTINTRATDISGTITSSQGELTGSIEKLEEVEHEGVISLVAGSITGTIENKTPTVGGTLTVHYGNDGAPGKDGFSPTITVHEETEKSYVLKITDVNGSYLTPNLKAEGCWGGGEDKVDEDLAEYRHFDPVTLNATQRENAFLYVRRDDTGENTKIDLASIALEDETNEKIRQKIQTVKERPTNDWKVGDYVFLETGERE